MSDSPLVRFNILKRNRLTPPRSSFKYSNFKDMCCTSAFLDSRCNETGKDPEADREEAPSVTSVSLLQGHSEHVHPSAFFPRSPSIEKEFHSISLSEERETNRSADLFETPKSGRKGSSLRRRLLLSNTVKAGTTGGCCERQLSSSGSIRKKIFSCVLSSEEKLSQTAAYSPKDKGYKTLTTSTSEPENSNPNSPKRRLSFSQQRTSTLEESQCKDPLLLESGLSPIQWKDVTASNTTEFNEYILVSVRDGVLRTPAYTRSSLPEASGGKYLTSIPSPVENLNFGLCDINSPPVKVANYPDLSTPEDSGYNSLPLDKSGDSLSDYEGSFQELFQKHKEDFRTLDSKRKTRKLERVRRLSTLQELGSQSETEDNHGSPTSMHMLTKERDFVSEDHELVLKEQPSGDLVVSHGDFSRTPALKIIHEICLRRQRLHQKQISENIDGTEIFALDHVLPGLIGKKMGLDKLDILTELKHRNLRHVLAIVLDASTVESLCREKGMLLQMNENNLWNTGCCCQQNLFFSEKKRHFLIEHLLKAEDAATRLNILNRSALRCVQAQARTPLLQTPPSHTEITPRRCSSVPHSASRQEEYMKVAKTLFTDEALKPCPRCQYPAKYQLVMKLGLCSREACAFEFCILCLQAFHGSKECNSLSAKRKNKKDAPPGSAQSKRNLKRL
ncbi:FBX43 protein, partial [Spizella passerina]|nr:FBX43 protein [Spizella passerina]